MKEFRAQHGDFVVGEVTVDMVSIEGRVFLCCLGRGGGREGMWGGGEGREGCGEGVCVGCG